MKLEDIKNKTKDAVDYLVQSLESGHSEVLTQYLGAMARFHTYSFGNVMLIARQKPDASNVAGIRTWNSLGRFVKRGEKGILILAPMVGTKRTRTKVRSRPRMPRAPSPPCWIPRGVRVRHHPDRRQRAAHAQRSRGRRERLPRTAGAVCRIARHRAELFRADWPRQGLIPRRKDHAAAGMQPAEEFSTLVHEIGHEMLHRGNRRTLTTKQVRETEAEAVAFVVCQSVGLKTGTASADYIQLWHGDANLLRESLEAVQQTAAVILGGIAPGPPAAAAAA